MVTVLACKNRILALTAVVELPHFNKSTFKLNSKIFATVSDKEKRVCIKLTEIDQSVLVMVDAAIMYPVPNKWGRLGWTYVELDKVNKMPLKEGLIKAYQHVAVNNNK